MAIPIMNVRMGNLDTSRRRLLKATGAAGVTGLGLSTAGCIETGDDDDGEPEDTPPDDEPELTEPVPELRFVMPTEGSNAERHELSLEAANNFEAVGFEIDRQQFDFGTQVEIALVEHNFDINVIGWGGTPERIDPHTFIHDLHHGSESNIGPGGRNSPGYNNPEYNDIADQQFVSVDMDERQQLVHQAQEILARDQPRTYIANEDDMHAYRHDNFENIVPTMGEGLNSFWNLIEATPLGDRDTLRFGYPTEITSLSPMQDMATPDRQWVRLLFDRLYRVTDEGIPEPWAAADDPTFEDDGETVVVPIREGMTFHDGEPVTAEDVAWSFEYFGEHSVTYGDRMAQVEEVNVTGDHEVTFHLTQAFAPFVANVLAQIYIWPQHIWQDVEDPVEVSIDDEETATGSGPYKFNQWDLEVELRLDAFEDHFSPPQVDRIIRVPGADTSTLVGMLEEDSIDMIGATPSVTAQNRMEDDPEITNVFAPTIAFFKFAYNMRNEVMQDVHLRRALSYCVPKQVYVDDMLGGVGTVTHSPIAEVNEFWHNPDVEQFHFDLDAAEQELANNGYGWDDDGRLHYTEDHDPQMFLDG